MAISQESRHQAALRILRGALQLPPLNAAERSRVASRLLAERWTRRNFSLTRYGFKPTWKGSELDVLHELSYYLMPRATWAKLRGNGEQWVRREMTYTLLALVQHKLGADAAKQLRQAYVEAGVKYRPRRTISAAQKARLVAQLTPTAIKENVKVTIAPLPPKPGRRRITFEDE